MAEELPTFHEIRSNAFVMLSGSVGGSAGRRVHEVRLYHLLMGIDDELNERLGSLPADRGLRTRRQIEGERIVREVRQLFKDIADALLARAIPRETILMRSPVPASKVKHFFLGADSNPLVPAGEGWEIITNWKIDTYGALWLPNRQTGNEGEWRKADMSFWQEQFTKEWRHGTPFIDQAGHQLYLKEEPNGTCWLQLYRSQCTTGEPDRLDEVREGLLQATAAYIAAHGR